MRALLLVSVTVLFIAVLAPFAAAHPATSGAPAHSAACGSVAYDGRAYVLYYRGISCRSARRKVRYVHRHKRLPGWRCSSGSNFRTGGACTRGRKQFGWHPFD
jgi:hypothetical protein